MHKQLSKQTIKRLAKENDLPEYKVKDVINSYFSFAAFVLRNDVSFAKRSTPTVRIPYFGKFFFPDFNKKKLSKFDEDI